MKLQAAIDSTDLDMTEANLRAFFLGALSAEKPMAFGKAIGELLSDMPEAKEKLEAPLKELWDGIVKNKKAEMKKLFPETEDLREFLEISRDQLDYFLSAMSLAGTSADNCEDEEMAQFLEELEEVVEDIEDYLADDEASEDDGNDIKEFLKDVMSEI